MENNGAFKWKIQKIVSKGDYNYAITKEHPKATKNGYVLEHRIVMENHLGRLLNSDHVEVDFLVRYNYKEEHLKCRRLYR